MTTVADSTSQERRQFITFRSGDQDFGANIMMIREIRGWTKTTALPHAPHFVRGVINLRGIVLPVIDLKALLGRGDTEADIKHVIVVVKAGERTIGLLVDAVSDILTVTAEDIQPTPDLVRDEQSEIVEGIAVLDGRMVTIIGLEKLATSLAHETDVTQKAA